MIGNILIYGLVNAAILLLTALGFSLVFGLSGVANFAHGGIYLGSGLVAWLLLERVGLPLPVAMLVAILLAALVGVALYHFILKPVRGIVLSEVIATFAVGVAILEFFRWRGFVTYEFNLPYLVQGNMRVLGQDIDYQRVIIVGLGVAMAGLLWLFSHKTRIGLALRGMAQDEYTGLSLGIDSDWAAAISLGIGGALAALAAVMVLPLGIISINIGYDVLLISLAVTVVGGLESTTGLMAAALILGFAATLTDTYIGPNWSQVVYLAAITLVLAVKPSGLLGKFKELEERV